MKAIFTRKELALAVACALAFGLLSEMASAQVGPDEHAMVKDSSGVPVTSGFGLCSGFGPAPLWNAKTVTSSSKYPGPGSRGNRPPYVRYRTVESPDGWRQWPGVACATKAEVNMPLRMTGKKSARQISAGLGSILLDTLGLTAAIEWHAHRFQKRTGLLCELTVDPAAPVNLPEDYAATIFEFYNEALVNAARHAMASRVAIALTITPRDVTVKFSLPLA